MHWPAARQPPRPGRAVRRRLLGLAAAVFLLGLGVYALARNTLLHSAWPAWSGLWPAARLLPAEITLSLPSFSHTCALALATAALSGRATRACAGWCAANAALEAAQWAGAQAWWPAALPAWLTRGHFDPLDLAAVLLGAVVAWGAVQTIQQQARNTGEGGHPWPHNDKLPWQH